MALSFYNKNVKKPIDKITCPVKGGPELLEDVLRKYGAVEVGAMDVYRDMFSLGDKQEPLRLTL